MPPVYAQVKVRVQARGGKILGPAATVKQPLLSVQNVLTGQTLVSDAPMNNGSSGTVVPGSQFGYGDSRNAITVQPPAISPTYPTPGPYWLVVPDGQGELIVQLHLTEPSLLEFRATAFAPDPVYASATMWVTPGMRLLADPGLVLTIAGLYTTVNASASSSTVNISANVTMMCGCPITPQPSQTLPPNTEPYWPSTEFTVTAQIRDLDGGGVAATELKCTDTSTFTGSIDLRRGLYDVWVVAVQANETNVGFAHTRLTV